MKQEIKERVERIRKGEVPEGYRKTKVGIIPDDWNILELNKHTTKISDGIHTTPKYVEKSEYFFINGNNLKNGKVVITANTKCVSGDEFKKHKRELNSNTILMSINGTIGECAFYNHEKVILGKSAAYVNCINKEDVLFIYYNLQSSRSINHYYSELTGSTIKNLSLKSLKETPIPSPYPKEREKIAEIISTWDKAIELKEELIEEKKEFKRVLMQKLLTGKIRFPEFNNEWTGISLNNLVNRITSKNKENNKTVITISAKEGFVNQDEYFNKLVASEDLSGYFLINKGDFAYNKSYSNGYPVGAIKRLDSFEKAVVTTLYICFRIKDGKVSSNFLKYYFDSGLLNRQIKRIANEGGRAHGLLNVTPKDFFNIKVILPEYEEQEKISAILLVNEQGIQLLEQELFELKEQKKGLMQLLLTGIVRVEVN